jgi:polyisoprenoid-binding protein YceI
VKDFSMERLTTDSSFYLDGILTIRGIEKRIQTKVFIKEGNNHLFVTANFSVHPEDFDIKIPSLVREKIAKEVQIKIKYEFIEKK